MTFKEYVAAIQKMAEEADATDPGKPYCDPEAWREAYLDDIPPEEAWAEEVSNATVG